MSMSKFHGACKEVVEKSKDPYARSYAQAGLSLHREDEMRMQALYILTNLGKWRGDDARRVKMVLKEIGHVKR